MPSRRGATRPCWPVPPSKRFFFLTRTAADPMPCHCAGVMRWAYVSRAWTSWSAISWPCTMPVGMLSPGHEWYARRCAIPPPFVAASPPRFTIVRLYVKVDTSHTTRGGLPCSMAGIKSPPMKSFWCSQSSPPPPPAQPHPSLSALLFNAHQVPADALHAPADTPLSRCNDAPCRRGQWSAALVQTTHFAGDPEADDSSDNTSTPLKTALVCALAWELKENTHGHLQP